MLQAYRTLRERWRILAICSLAGIVGGAVTALLIPPTYTATLQLYVSAQPDQNSPQFAYQGAQLSERRVSSYSQLILGDRVASEVALRLGDSELAPAVEDKLSTSYEDNSVLIDVSATDRSPEAAASVVNAVGDVFPGLVSEIERPTTPGAQPPVQVRVVSPADPPTEPSSPTVGVQLALGLFAGLLLGCGTALLMARMDRTVKAADSIPESSGLSVLATIPEDRGRSTGARASFGFAAEAVRKIRTSLRFARADGRIKSVAIVGPGADIGKSFTATALAEASAAAGDTVVLVEADFKRPSIAANMRLDGRVGISSVLSRRVDLVSAIQRSELGFDVLATGPVPRNSSEIVSAKAFHDLIDALSRRYDKVIVDTPAMLTFSDAVAIGRAVDGVVLLARHGVTKQENLGRAYRLISDSGGTVLGAVVSRVPRRQLGGYYGYYGYNTYDDGGYVSGDRSEANASNV